MAANEDTEQVKIRFNARSCNSTTLAIEKRNATITALAIFVPLLIAAISFASSVHTQDRQAVFDFQLKAADVVLNSDGPSEAR